ncbi:glycosyltransferase family 4 protein [Shewanella youngdeokensis]|uniref:Glycosyltransferase family 4 protein n=1 Tax=Shewanella youngdeokensis TaxID=2999068 RepID=A0ABZ0K201_9GAMM|nr:glycosyltransferase family 4 protein [Shewanella sp. DAU334]
MQPKIIHLIDDAKLGGVNLALESLAASTLNQSFEFQLHHIQLIKPSFCRYQAQVIVVHGALSWRKIPALIAIKLANMSTPLMYQEHHYCREFVRHCVGKPYRFKWLLTLGYSLMDKVLTVSDQQADWLVECGVISETKLARVGQAKQVEPFLAIPKAKQATPLKLVAYGRLSKQKGFDLLIKAMASFNAKQVTLAIAGDGEDKGALQQLAQAMPHVTFVGEINDVPTFLRSGDVVVIPSRWEPFGLTCMESIAAGRHVVLPALDGLADQIDDLKDVGGKQGYEVINPLTATGIVEAIERVSRSAEIGSNQLQRQATQLAWQRVQTRWLQLLQQHC